MVSEGGYTLQPDGLKEAEKYIRSFDRSREDFGNAREVRSFFERILPAQALRLADLPNFESLSNEDLLAMTFDDVR